MSSSNETSASSGTNGSAPPSPTLSLMQQLKAELDRKAPKAVLEDCLGLKKLDGVSELADNMIVVCFDTESWIHNHNKLTELGVATFDSRDTRALKKPGAYGEGLLKQVYFYHARIEENAHLLNIKFCPGDPDANRFGQTRFVNELDTQKMLDSIFRWPIDPSKPELGSCPVVVLGHSLKDDFLMLSRTLGVNPAVFDTVVKTIDTQHLCRETGFVNSRNQVGLSTLVSQADFEYRDAHTACNDAAMTLICAVQMVLPPHLKDPVASPDRSLQDIINNIEIVSRAQEWYWGSPNYCIRCGSRNHTHSKSTGHHCKVKVKCEHCAASSKESGKRAAKCPVTQHCVSFALKGPQDGAEDVIAGRLGAMSFDY